MGRAMRVGRAALLCVPLALLAACGGDDGLMNIGRSQNEPDEFAILPTKPIEIPGTLDLPPPTPGAANRTDPTPEADTVAALGGSPVALARSGEYRGEPALLNQVTRFGVRPSIRSELASADAAFRRDNRGRLLERVFNVNRYYSVYAGQSLDQHRELERFRRLGVRTVGAPPDPAE